MYQWPRLLPFCDWHRVSQWKSCQHQALVSGHSIYQRSLGTRIETLSRRLSSFVGEASKYNYWNEPPQEIYLYEFEIFCLLWGSWAVMDFAQKYNTRGWVDNLRFSNANVSASVTLFQVCVLHCIKRKSDTDTSSKNGLMLIEARSQEITQLLQY